MTTNWADKRKEFRFQLKGSFEGYRFALGSHHVEAKPLDISRNGLGVMVDQLVEKDTEMELKIHFPDDRPPVTLQVRFRVCEQVQGRMRYGLELSDKDKRRGIDLISMLSGTPKLRLSCAS